MPIVPTTSGNSFSILCHLFSLCWRQQWCGRVTPKHTTYYNRIRKHKYLVEINNNYYGRVPQQKLPFVLKEETWNSQSTTSIVSCCTWITTVTSSFLYSSTHCTATLLSMYSILRTRSINSEYSEYCNKCFLLYSSTKIFFLDVATRSSATKAPLVLEEVLQSSYSKWRFGVLRGLQQLLPLPGVVLGSTRCTRSTLK